MSQVREYIISVLSVAILVSIIVRISGGQKTVSGLVRILGSILIVITVISPLLTMKINDTSVFISTLKFDAEDIIANAKNKVTEDTAEIITEKIQSYIMDKASKYGANIIATVKLAEPELQVPDTITIQGQVSAYTKSVLQEIIVNDLGICMENQIWL